MNRLDPTDLENVIIQPFVKYSTLTNCPSMNQFEKFNPNKIHQRVTCIIVLTSSEGA
jgi:hypothetical protein